MFPLRSSWTMLSIYATQMSLLAPTHPSPCSPSEKPLRQIEVRYQEAGSLMLLHSPFASLDENANLGTVMRYEEIGEWGWKARLFGASCLKGYSGGGGGLQPLGVFAAGSALGRVINCSQAKSMFLVISPVPSPNWTPAVSLEVGWGPWAVSPLERLHLIQKTWKFQFIASQRFFSCPQPCPQKIPTFLSGGVQCLEPCHDLPTALGGH